MKHIKLFENFVDERIPRFTGSDLEDYKKRGAYYMTFYPARAGGSSFTIAEDQDVRTMRDLLKNRDVGCNVGFGPYYHNGQRDPKSMVVILHSTGSELEKEKKIVYDIIDRNFSLNYPTHQLGGW